MPIRQAEPLNLISSITRQKLSNPNIANADFNPILHQKNYVSSSPNEYKPINKDYGSIPSKQANFPAGLVAPNTTAGNNGIFSK